MFWLVVTTQHKISEKEIAAQFSTQIFFAVHTLLSANFCAKLSRLAKNSSGKLMMVKFWRSMKRTPIQVCGTSAD